MGAKWMMLAGVLVTLYVVTVNLSTPISLKNYQLDVSHCLSKFDVGSGHWEQDQWMPSGPCLYEPLRADTSATLERLKQCIAGKRLAFVGDSRVRQLYYTLLDLVDPTFNASEDAQKQHANLHKTPSISVGSQHKTASVQFFWRPEIYDSQLQDLFVKLKKAPPDFLLVSAGLWALKRGDSTDAISLACHHLTPHITSMATLTNTLWLPLGLVNEELLHPARANLTNNGINTLNTAMLERLCGVGIGHCQSTLRALGVYGNSINQTWDGLHFNNEVQRKSLEILVYYVYKRFVKLCWQPCWMISVRKKNVFVNDMKQVCLLSRIKICTK
eukprot:m.46001 g.46001  ORF g.46001 m.46001 type:complete len:329 (-) comp10326_c0_seq1:1242-2228(-)